MPSVALLSKGLSMFPWPGNGGASLHRFAPAVMHWGVLSARRHPVAWRSSTLSFSLDLQGAQTPLHGLSRNFFHQGCRAACGIQFRRDYLECVKPLESQGIR